MVSLLVGVLTLVGSANAAIMDIDGGVQVAAPASVVEGQLESDLFHVFPESYDVPIDGLAVDLLGDGTIVFPLAGAGVLGGPIWVDSYLVHFDPGAPFAGGHKWLSGSVTFNAAILAVIVGDALLDASDAVLGAWGTTYPTGVSGRGLEDNRRRSDDSVTVLGNVLTISLLLETGNASNKLDQMRVITAGYTLDEAALTEAPEPATLAILCLGLAAMGLIGRRRRAG